MQRFVLATDRSEDNMCPSFLPLPSERRRGERPAPAAVHLPQQGMPVLHRHLRHRRRPISAGAARPHDWCDNAYFAPEALIDGQGRQIMWAWIFDDRPQEVWRPSGWNGMYGLPRSLWLGDDGGLRMPPGGRAGPAAPGAPLKGLLHGKRRPRG